MSSRHVGAAVVSTRTPAASAFLTERRILTRWAGARTGPSASTPTPPPTSSSPPPGLDPGGRGERDGPRRLRTSCSSTAPSRRHRLGPRPHPCWATGTKAGSRLKPGEPRLDSVQVQHPSKVTPIRTGQPAVKLAGMSDLLERLPRTRMADDPQRRVVANTRRRPCTPDATRSLRAVAKLPEISGRRSTHAGRAGLARRGPGVSTTSSQALRPNAHKPHHLWSAQLRLRSRRPPGRNRPRRPPRSERFASRSGRQGDLPRPVPNSRARNTRLKANA